MNIHVNQRKRTCTCAYYTEMVLSICSRLYVNLWLQIRHIDVAGLNYGWIKVWLNKRMKEWNRFLDVEGIFLFKKLIENTIYPAGALLCRHIKINLSNIKLKYIQFNLGKVFLSFIFFSNMNYWIVINLLWFPGKLKFKAEM